MEITVLSFEGCPNAEPAIQLVRQTVRELGLDFPVKSVVVRDPQEAEKMHFLGSPSVQINGLDIEAGRRSDAASFSCRLYPTPAGDLGVPPKQMIVDAIYEAQARPRFHG